MAEEKLPAALTARQKMVAALNEQRPTYELLKKAAKAIKDTGEPTPELDSVIDLMDGLFKAIK